LFCKTYSFFDLTEGAGLHLVAREKEYERDRGQPADTPRTPNSKGSARESDLEEQAMVDIDLLVKVLKQRGHSVETVFPVPENAGEYELSVDGNLLPLEEARMLLERDQARATY